MTQEAETTADTTLAQHEPDAETQLAKKLDKTASSQAVPTAPPTIQEQGGEAEEAEPFVDAAAEKQGEACAALKNLAGNSDINTEMARETVIAAVLKTLQIHPTDAAVLQHACW